MPLTVSSTWLGRLLWQHHTTSRKPASQALTLLCYLALQHSQSHACTCHTAAQMRKYGSSNQASITQHVFHALFHQNLCSLCLQAVVSGPLSCGTWHWHICRGSPCVFGRSCSCSGGLASTLCIGCKLYTSANIASAQLTWCFSVKSQLLQHMHAKPLTSQQLLSEAPVFFCTSAACPVSTATQY